MEIEDLLNEMVALNLHTVIWNVTCRSSLFLEDIDWFSILIAPSKFEAPHKGPYYLSKDLLTDIDLAVISSDKWTLNFSSNYFDKYNCSALCEPCIPLKGTHSFTATFRWTYGDFACIGLAWSSFKGTNLLIGKDGFNSWGYESSDGGIYLNNSGKS